MDRDHAPVTRLPRSLQNSRNLDRMVRVIINDRRPVPFADTGEAAVHASELSHSSFDIFSTDPQVPGNGNRRQQVRHIMIAGHRQT